MGYADPFIILQTVKGYTGGFLLGGAFARASAGAEHFSFKDDINNETTIVGWTGRLNSPVAWR
jgi:hypothetical protein